MLRIDEMPEFRTKNSPKFVTAAPSDTIKSSILKMSKAGVHGVTVVKNKKPVGIFTETDVIKKVILGKVKMTDKMQTVMTKKPKTLTADHHAGDAIELMRKGNFRYLPIVDHNKNLRGIVSQHDLMALDLKEMFLKSAHRGIMDFFKLSPIYILLLAIMIYIAFVVTLIFV